MRRNDMRDIFPVVQCRLRPAGIYRRGTVARDEHPRIVLEAQIPVDRNLAALVDRKPPRLVQVCRAHSGGPYDGLRPHLHIPQKDLLAFLALYRAVEKYVHPESAQVVFDAARERSGKRGEDLARTLD